MRSKRELSQIIFMFFIFLSLLLFKLATQGNAALLEQNAHATTSTAIHPIDYK